MRHRRTNRVPPLLALLLALAAGCGGSQTTGTNAPAPTPAPTATRVTVPVTWPARSRAIAAPASALSMTITLAGAKPEGGDLTFTVNRDPARTDEYTANHASPSPARLGTCLLTVGFFAEADGAGAQVGTAQAMVTVVAASDNSGSGTVTTGSGGTTIVITTRSAVASVEVLSGQSVRVGAKSDLVFTARNESGSILALSPGSALFTVTEGAGSLRFVDGQAEGVLPGAARVTATVDGVTSPAQSVAVTSDASVTVTPAAATISIGAAQTFTAGVTGTGNTAVTWSVREGASGGSVTEGGVYTAPNTPGTYHVIAASQFDPAKSATATVEVKSGGASVVVE